MVPTVDQRALAPWADSNPLRSPGVWLLNGLRTAHPPKSQARLSSGFRLSSYSQRFIRHRRLVVGRRKLVLRPLGQFRKDLRPRPLCSWSHDSSGFLVPCRALALFHEAAELRPELGVNLVALQDRVQFGQLGDHGSVLFVLCCVVCTGVLFNAPENGPKTRRVDSDFRQVSPRRDTASPRPRAACAGSLRCARSSTCGRRHPAIRCGSCPGWGCRCRC